MAHTLPVSGTAIGRVYRLAQQTDKVLDGLPLYAAPFPCGVPEGAISVGCCPTEMPTEMSFDITDPAGTTTTYTLVWGDWNGDGYKFWQYTAASMTAYDVVYQISWSCGGVVRGQVIGSMVVRWGDILYGDGSTTGTYYRLGTSTYAYCCSTGISTFSWDATITIISGSTVISGSVVPSGGGVE